jgi:hypothetical protein
MTGGNAEVDAATRAFTSKVFGMISGGVSAFMIDLGLRAGLFDAASGAGPLTSDELAERAGLDERYVREWLAAMTTAGVFRLNGDRFELPEAHAVCLSGQTSSNVAPRAQMVGFLAQHLESVASAFRDGAGVPYAAFRPGFTGLMHRSRTRASSASTSPRTRSPMAKLRLPSSGWATLGSRCET